MFIPSRFSHLTLSDQWLIRQLQQIAFGRLTICVRGGSADSSAGCRVVRTQKLIGGECGPRHQAERSDFDLRDEHVALLKHLRALPDKARVTVKVAIGLPTTSIDIEEDYIAA